MRDFLEQPKYGEIRQEIHGSPPANKEGSRTQDAGASSKKEKSYADGLSNKKARTGQSIVRSRRGEKDTKS